jgi:hypothetical protein
VAIVGLRGGVCPDIEAENRTKKRRAGKSLRIGTFFEVSRWF